ncbi:MAG: caspase family protein, partial [Gammaproteobacteria bacterium]
MAQSISLHIAVNQCDPSRYAGWVGELEGPENDCDTMAEITSNAGFAATKLKTPEATCQNVIDAIEHAAASLEHGDTFVITFAGHGASRKDRSDDEADGRDETWCLYDGEFFDDELGGLFTKFKDGVEIIGFFDCCHSATMINDRALSHTTSGEVVAREPLVAAAIQSGDARTREMPPEIRARVRSENAERYRLRKMSPLATITDPVEACVLIFSACDDNEESKELHANGLFTQALKAVWDDGRYNGTYKTFRDDIVAKLPESQTPQLSFIGDVEVLIAQRPFAMSYG